MLRLLETFFRHRWSYLMTAALPIVAGVLFFLFVPAGYQVRGTIYVQGESLLTTLSSERQVQQFTTPSQATLSEVTSLLNTESFVEAVLQNTNLRDRLSAGPRERDRLLEEYRQAMLVTAEGSNIVVFTAEDNDPVVAQQLATETMNAYVQWRINFERTDSEVAQTFFSELIARYDEELAIAEQDLRDYLLNYPDPVRGERASEEKFEISRLQGLVDEATARLTEARDKEENARLALAKVNSNALQEYLVIDAPSVPNTPPSVAKRAMLILSVFTVLGLILALARLGLAIMLDRSLYFPIDVQHSLKQVALGMLPFQGANGVGQAGRRKASAAQDPNAPPSSGQVSTAKG